MPALLQSWGVPREQVCVLGSLYIDLALFSPPETAPEPEQDVFFVGRMVNNKGLDRLVDALALLRGRGLPLTALLLGRGPLRSATEERVRAHGLDGAVRFLDWVDTPEDLAELYRKSRVAVCASTCEGGPRVTVEAMACGTPVASTRVGIMGELVIEGRNGALADWTTEGLADALGRVCADEDARREMGRNASADVQRFEYAHMIRGYADGLKRLAGAEA